MTERNKVEYINLLVQHRLQGRIRDQLEAFKTGLFEIVPLEALMVFDEREVRCFPPPPLFSARLTMFSLLLVGAFDWRNFRN